MKAEIEVLQPGLFSTIQDLGRFGLMKYGVPLGGVMDSYSAQTANLLLQNSAESAVMEITQMGPKLKFSSPVEIVITGANLSPHINSLPVQNNKVYALFPQDILSFGKRQNGCRAYLGIKGGFQTKEILGSRSWFEDLTPFARLTKGMKLKYISSKGYQKNTGSAIKTNSYLLETVSLEILKGPEYERLSNELKNAFATQDFHIGKNYNRMAIQFDEQFPNSLEPIITGPVVPGTVQLTRGGNIIILMRDCQTTGGYPRVFQLPEKSINLLSQKIMGDPINLKIISS